MKQDEKNWNDGKQKEAQRREEGRDKDMLTKTTNRRKWGKGIVAVTLLAMLAFGTSTTAFAVQQIGRAHV